MAPYCGFGHTPSSTDFCFFFRFADTLVALSEEVTKLREELKNLKEKGLKSSDSSSLKEIKDDISFIKSTICSVNRQTDSGSKRVPKKGPEAPASPEEAPWKDIRDDINIIKSSLKSLNPTGSDKSASKRGREAPAHSDAAKASRATSSKDTHKTFADVVVRPPKESENGPAPTKKHEAPRKMSTVSNPSTKDATNEGQWVEVIRTRLRTYRKIIGKTQSNSFFQGTESLADLYVGGCDKDTTPEHILNYCKEVLKIEPRECTLLESKYKYYKAFKLKIKLVDRPLVLKPECWPVNTFVNKFQNRRNISNRSK